jgi:hypothetical protein
MHQLAQTIALKVALRADDEAADAPGLPMIFGRSSCAAFSRQAIAQVVYHNKAPTFQDEVKIKLPTRLTDKLHLLFTFYNVSVQRPKKGEDELESPIGYAVLPLYENGKLPENNQGDLIGLPIVVSKRPDHYMSEEARSKAIYLDNGKPLFRTRLRMVSTIYPDDPALTQFYKFFSTTDNERELSQALDGFVHHQHARIHYCKGTLAP